MKAIITLLLLISLVRSTSVGQERNIIKEGSKLSLKSSSVLGKNAKIFTYCQELKGSKNCQELIISDNGSKVWMPTKSGPIYNVLKTGKTSNFNGLTQLKSKNGKIQTYYTYSNNQFSFLTPVDKLSYRVTIFDGGKKSLSSVEVTRTIQEEADDIVNCIQGYCLNKWSECIKAIPPSSTLPGGSAEYWSRFSKCTDENQSCQQDCKNIEMEHVNTILVFRQTSGASSFNLAILK